MQPGLHPGCTRFGGYRSPMLARMISPGNQPASSEARNTTTLAMSAGVPMRPKGRIMAAGLRWGDGSYLLFVEPRLIGNLYVVSVPVADVCLEVDGTPFGPNARVLDLSNSRVYLNPVDGPA